MRKRKLNESYIQRECVRYAKARGYWARKFSSPGRRSVPDYIFSKKFGQAQVMWLEEFKAEGEKPSTLQLREHTRCRNAGWIVHPDTGRLGRDDIMNFEARIDALEGIYA